MSSYLDSSHLARNKKLQHMELDAVTTTIKTSIQQIDVVQSVFKRKLSIFTHDSMYGVLCTISVQNFYF